MAFYNFTKLLPTSLFKSLKQNNLSNMIFIAKSERIRSSALLMYILMEFHKAHWCGFDSSGQKRQYFPHLRESIDLISFIKIFKLTQ